MLLVAADTFRAAAAEQLTIWAERAGVDIVRGNEGADPSSVVFDGMAAAKARGADVVLVDTAGRLQTKTNLMEELKKMRRVIERETGAPPAETLLFLDGTTGQNALSQAKLFNEATQLTGVIVTKLDSTAKGGVLVGDRRSAHGADQIHRPRGDGRRAAAVRSRRVHESAVRGSGVNAGRRSSSTSTARCSTSRRSTPRPRESRAEPAAFVAAWRKTASSTTRAAAASSAATKTSIG